MSGIEKYGDLVVVLWTHKWVHPRLFFILLYTCHRAEMCLPIVPKQSSPVYFHVDFLAEFDLLKLNSSLIWDHTWNRQASKKKIVQGKHSSSSMNLPISLQGRTKNQEHIRWYKCTYIVILSMTKWNQRCYTNRRREGGSRNEIN